jgi:hypothetical protein
MILKILRFAPALERAHARGTKQACGFFAASLVTAVKKTKKKVELQEHP